MTENCGTLASAPLKAFAQLIEASTKAGADFLNSLYGGASGVSGAIGALDGMVNWASSQGGGRSCCSCEIPPPCWMPKPLCPVVSYGKPGDAASITFVITNESMTTRTVAISTSTTVSGLIFSANELTLGPMERSRVEATYTVPATLKSGPRTEILLWIQGCKLHFLRWTMKLGPLSADTNYEVCVNDGPENVHHWYDHFYCPHPCLPDRRAAGR